MEGELTLFAQGCNLWKTMPDFDRRSTKKRADESQNSPAHWTRVDLSLEVEPQAELHAARFSKQFARNPQIASSQLAAD
jgi:hypothetical protein